MYKEDWILFKEPDQISHEIRFKFSKRKLDVSFWLLADVKRRRQFGPLSCANRTF